MKLTPLLPALLVLSLLASSCTEKDGAATKSAAEVKPQASTTLAAKEAPAAPQSAAAVEYPKGPGPAGSVTFIEYFSDEPVKLAEFYAKQFGWQIEVQDEHEVLFLAPNGMAGIFSAPDAESEGLAYLIYIRVKDVNESLKAAEALGYWTEGEAMETANGSLTARLEDPAGNIVGIWSEKAGASQTPGA